MGGEPTLAESQVILRGRGDSQSRLALTGIPLDLGIGDFRTGPGDIQGILEAIEEQAAGSRPSRLLRRPSSNCR